MSREQILSLLGAITDLHDLCLMSHRNLLRAALQRGDRVPVEVLERASLWCRSGPPLRASSTWVELRPNRAKRRSRYRSRFVQSSRLGSAICPDVSPEALMFPTFGRGERERDRQFRAGEKLSQVEDTARCPQTPYPGSPRHLPGDAADAGNRHAALWKAQGHAGHSSTCKHPYHGRYLRAGGRGKRHARGQLSRQRGTRWLDSGD